MLSALHSMIVGALSLLDPEALSAWEMCQTWCKTLIRWLLLDSQSKSSCALIGSWWRFCELDGSERFELFLGHIGRLQLLERPCCCACSPSWQQGVEQSAEASGGTVIVATALCLLSSCCSPVRRQLVKGCGCWFCCCGLLPCCRDDHVCFRHLRQAGCSFAGSV